mmetsp:Transcript_82149/g.236037  ORF Transcript_82149/g.236037 Transcript_82149/m.236037 type:complete len:394 (-) Transcript_82149:65-1246(-)
MLGGERGGPADRARTRTRSIALPLLAIVVPWQVWLRSSFLLGQQEGPPGSGRQAEEASQDEDATVPAESVEQATPILETHAPERPGLGSGSPKMLPANLRLVVFDLAGTTLDDLVDGEPLAILAIRKAFARVGIEVSSASLTPLRGLEKREAIRRHCTQLLGKGREAEAEELAHAVSAHFEESLAESLRHGPLREMPGTTSVFEALRARGVRVVIGSGFDEAIVREVVQRLGWQVDGVVAARRPRPEAIFQAMAMADVDSVRDVLKVGDTVADVEEGRNAGVWTAAVLTGTQGEAALRSARPDFVFGAVADMLRLLPPLGAAEDTPEDARPTASRSERGSVLSPEPAAVEAPAAAEGPIERPAEKREDVFLRGQSPRRQQQQEEEEEDGGLQK